MSLRTFRYGARSSDGTLVTGLVGAESANAAAIDLRRRSLVVTSVKESKRYAAGFAWRRPKALHGFYRAFSVLLRSGITMRRALSVAITHCKERQLQESLRAVLSDVEHGSSLSTAMERRPREFPPLHAAMVGAGEIGGALDEVLERITALLDREHIIRKRVTSALAYPALVAGSASCVIVFLITRIVPMFAGMFHQFGAPLPMPTRVLMGIATTMNSPLAAVAAPGVGLTVALAIVTSARFSGERFDRLRLRIPILGAILRMAIVARIARMVGMLLRCGVSILPSIDASLAACGSPLYAAALRQIADGLRRGEVLHLCMSRCGLFDPLLVALVAAGDETGTVDKMLLAAADYLDVEVEAALSAFAAVVEPTLIAVLGLVVGFIVFSIFLPLYSLIGSLS